MRYLRLAPLLTASVVTGAAQAGGDAVDAAGPIRYREQPGVREFSGRLIVKPRTERGGLAPSPAARARLKGWALRHEPATDEYVLRVPPGENENSLAAALLATGEYEYAEPDWRVHAARVPDDAEYPAQWHLPRVRAPDAWDVTTGQRTVIVAVCDSGIQKGHEDLAASLVPGFNAVDRRAETEGGNADAITEHGTQVAGVIAAAGDNRVGVAGMGWQLGLMPIRVSNIANDTALISDLNAGARWAAEHGARVVNASFSQVASASVSTTGRYIRDKGGLYVWAAGNAAGIAAATDLPDVVVVAATTEADEPARFSNGGPAIDIAAPGVGIRTTTLASYGDTTGTSFAAPIVSGALGLIFAANPAFKPGQAEAALLSTAADAGEPGRDGRTGCGIVDAGAAVSLAKEAFSNPRAPFARDDEACRTEPGPLTIDVLANDVDLNADWAGPESLSIADFDRTTAAGGSVVRSTGPLGRQALAYAPRPGFRGTDTFSYTVSDAGGLTAAARVRVGVGEAPLFAPPLTALDAALSTAYTALAVGDFDGDGDPDVAAAAASLSNTVAFYRNNGAGGFGFVRSVPLPLAADSIGAADFNHDGRADLVLCGNTHDLVCVALSTGAFTLGTPQTFAVPDPTCVIAADESGRPFDVNGDGHHDFVHLRRSGSLVSVDVRVGDGAGGFPAPAARSLPVHVSPQVVRAADVNGDGLTDLVAACSGSSVLSVLLNQGAGRFGVAIGSPIGMSPTDLALADVDGDGDADAVAISRGLVVDLPGPRVALNEGAGEMRVTAHLPTVAVAPLSVAAADLDGDRRVDLVTSNPGSTDLTVHVGLGRDGFLATPFTVRTGATGVSVAEVADLNGDTRPDVLVACLAPRPAPAPPGTRSGIQVLLNVTSPPAACPADFDRSGDQPDQLDIFAYLSAWFAADPRAEFDDTPLLDIRDLFAFLATWFAGC